MKSILKYIFHKLFGFRNYLFLFSKYKIRTLHRDQKERDFFLFMDQLPAKGVILDIGANIGVMTYHLSRRFPDSKIYAFEPVPVNHHTLKRIQRKFDLKNVELMEIALGNKEGEAEMVLPVEGRVRLHGLSHIMHESIEEFNEGIKLNVPVKRLDNLSVANGTGPKVTGIKMDVENFEFFVLDGARELLKRDKPLIYTELWDNENRRKCFRLARELGYSIKVVRKGKITDYQEGTDANQNFIFAPTA